MTAAVERRSPHPLPLSSTPAELPPFSFPAAPQASSTDASSPQQTPTQATFDSARTKVHAPIQAAPEGEQPPDAASATDSPSRRTRGHRHTSSLDSVDVTMGEDDDHDSDNDSVGSDSRPSKKKKSQRFYCTQYPPCNLSFTRSEHLARHIRKHTGERPFQCHCLRRFSRLDNLRQHAQTVHVNEDIPGDSLAATGTRFQRQIRTERIRTTSHRARASTLSTPGGHNRGHSRNMSNSSIGSISDLGSPDDGRRRPPPLAMAQSPRHGLATDIHGASTGSAEAGQYPPGYYYSPSGYSTPVSVFSHDAGSPTASSLQSPITFAPRTPGWEERSLGHARRLSVPSQPTPTFYHSAHGAGPSYAAGPPQSPVGPPFSPTGSTFSSHPDGRHEPSSPEVYLKRRTWHPSTYTAARPATSGLSYYQTPDTPLPVAATQPAAQQSIQLPGISSFFDRAQGQLAPPPRRRPSSHMMDIDEPSRSDKAPSTAGSDSGSKRNSWGSVSQHMSQMDLTHGPPSWRPIPAQSAQHSIPGPHGSTVPAEVAIPAATLPVQEPPLAVEPPTTPRHIKRQAWVGPSPTAASDGTGNAGTLRTSPEGSSSTTSGEQIRTPATGSVSGCNQAMVYSTSFPDAHSHHSLNEGPKVDVVRTPDFQGPPAPPSFQAANKNTGMDRLDALVAVATQTSEAMRQ